MSVIARAIALPAVGMSAALMVLYFWGPSVDGFDQEELAFSVASVVVAVCCMWVVARRMPSAGSFYLDLGVGVILAVFLLIPGGLLFGLLALAFAPLPVVPGLVAASFTFPRGSRRWIPVLWGAAAALFVASGYVVAATVEPGLNSSEGVSMTASRVFVWAAVLALSVVVSAIADWRVPGRRREEPAAVPTQPAPSSDAV